MRLFHLLILLTFGGCVFGQIAPQSDAKPRLELICPDAMVTAGEEFIVKARFGPVKAGTPVYNWTVSTGKILSGQGTQEIAVRAEMEGVQVTTTLEIGGGPFWFEPLVESCTTAVLMRPKARPLAEFGTKNIGYVELKFDELFAELWNDPTAHGVIELTGPSPRRRGDLRRWAERLAKIRKFDSSRLTFVDGGRAKSKKFSLWVVPLGADLPKIPR